MTPFDAAGGGAQDRLGQAQGGRFAENARRLAGAAGVMFGWAPAVFWAATPAELGGLLDAIRGEAELPPDADTFARLKEQFPDG